LESAVAFLAGENAMPELEGTVVLVPTAEAGRRLRRALAEWADGRRGAVSVPHVWPPNMALSPVQDRGRAASDLEARLTWVRVLKEGPPQAFKALLPSLPETISWKWLWDLAVTLVDLQELLGAGGLAFADVAARAADLPGSEVARWRDLARLEALFLAELEKRGMAHSQALKRERAASPWLPEGVTRVVVLAAPDLPPLMSQWMQGCVEAGVEVIVAVQAAEGMEEAFDAWGRPSVQQWGEDSPVDVGLTEAEIRLCRNPVGQAEDVVRWLSDAAEQGLPVAVGVCDAEVSPLLMEKLEARGLAVFEPGGIPMPQDGLWHLLTLMGELQGMGSWRAFCGLLRIEEVRKAWCGSIETGVIRRLDKFCAEHLPGSLDLAADLLVERTEDFAALRKAVDEAQKWRSKLAKEGLTQVAREWLIALYGDRGFRTEAPGDRERVQLAWAWLAEVEAVETALKQMGLEAGRQEEWMMVMERLSSGVLEPARGEVDLVIQGWLELLWENAPALVVAGLNEENVPGVLLGHPFLPDRFRQMLGLPCQATRFARDAYLLCALVRQRRPGGLFGVTVGRWSANDDVRKPSRLLTLCPEANLPARVRHLFPEKEAAEVVGEPIRSLLWTLKPEHKPMAVERISASRISAYLDCPFRFYLKYGLRMETVGGAAREMDAMQFGNLVHEVLRQFGEDADARQWVEAARIQKWFKERIEDQARAMFGHRLPPLVRLQVDAAAQRLNWQAEVEARERQAGWQIVGVELDLGSDGDLYPLWIEGARFTGKVDRIEHHPGTGERRVLDFKTSDKVTNPMDAHCKSVKQVEESERWKTFSIGGEEGVWRWLDVQLPLYAAALKNHPLGPVTQVGYACLPKGVMDTDLMLWPDFDERWVDAALDIAAEVVKRVRAGVFWPPNEGQVRSREFDELFPGGVMSAVSWEN
jgi:ATP-dependent helicase/nuclease subunit B